MLYYNAVVPVLSGHFKMHPKLSVEKVYHFIKLAVFVHENMRILFRLKISYGIKKYSAKWLSVQTGISLLMRMIKIIRSLAFSCGTFHSELPNCERKLQVFSDAEQKFEQFFFVQTLKVSPLIKVAGWIDINSRFRTINRNGVSCSRVSWILSPESWLFCMNVPQNKDDITFDEPMKGCKNIWTENLLHI